MNEERKKREVALSKVALDRALRTYQDIATAHNLTAQQAERLWHELTQAAIEGVAHDFEGMTAEEIESIEYGVAKITRPGVIRPRYWLRLTKEQKLEALEAMVNENARRWSERQAQA